MIDWDRVSQLRAEIGDDDFTEVAEIFLQEIGETLHQLLADPEAVRATDFHFLRGSAVNIGFRDVAEIARRAEQAARSGEVPDVAGLCDAFDAARARLIEVHPEIAPVAA